MFQGLQFSVADRGAHFKNFSNAISAANPSNYEFWKLFRPILIFNLVTLREQLVKSKRNDVLIYKFEFSFLFPPSTSRRSSSKGARDNN